LNDAIEFIDGSLMSTPTWRASSRCFTTKPTKGYPRGGRFYVGCRRDQELKMSYVVVCITLDVIALEGSLSALI
jgi:hypothetical protein